MSTLKVYEQLEQRTQEWLEARRGIVTASAVGRLLTPTGRPASNDHSRSLTAALVAERITGEVDQPYVNADMWRGVVEEPRARDKYAEFTGTEVTEVGFMVRSGDGWTLGYSPDGLVGDDGLLEVKAPRPKTHIATVLAGEVPGHHMAQLQAGLLVSGRKWIDYVSWSGGLAMWPKRVYPDPDWQAAIVAAVTAFETTAAEQVAAYEQATRGLAMTERAPNLELVI